jgi:hypothetical protein
MTQRLEPAQLAAQAASWERNAKKYGLAGPQDIQAGPLRYRWDLIERDIATLLRRPRNLPLGSKNRVPEAFVSYLASVFLACCEREGRAPSNELTVLVGQQLGVSCFGTKGVDPSQLYAAQQLRADNPSISNRDIAKKVRVNLSTVGRWVREKFLAPPAPV